MFVFQIVTKLQKVNKFQVDKFSWILVTAHIFVIRLVEFIITKLRIIIVIIIIIHVLTNAPLFGFLFQVLLDDLELRLENVAHVVCTLGLL